MRSTITTFKLLLVGFVLSAPTVLVLLSTPANLGFESAEVNGASASSQALQRETEVMLQKGYRSGAGGPFWL